ncbi:MAG: sugar nucleotide-binding protein [Planctomycetota bacterium]
MNDVVLLTGATGYVGGYVARELLARGLEVRTLGRHGCDITQDLGDPPGAAAAVAETAPRWVLNCGAVANMLACQEDPQRASAVNAKAPVAMVKAAPHRFLQVSTDLVFAGDEAPYKSSATPSPLSVYGMTKAEAEKVAKVQGTVVVRVPLLFGPSPDQQRGATDMLLRAIRDKQAVILFTDEFRTPLHAADAARGLVDILLDEDAVGTRHLGGYERVSRFDLAMRLAKVKDLPIDWFDQGLLDDPRRPRDVSLTGDWEPGRELDDALAES